MVDFSIFAPAKINLYLHVTGRRDDGYHALDSVVGFADFGDRLEFSQADVFSFSVGGPFSDKIDVSDNLVVRAVEGIAHLAGQYPNFSVHLDKQIPVGAGLGGGSADAAATVEGALQYWGIAAGDVSGLDDFLLSLGADVPVCFYGHAGRIRGIGEIVEPVNLSPLYMVLVYPNKACSTQAVFQNYRGDFREIISLSEVTVDVLSMQTNDLLEAAIVQVPEIADVLSFLSEQEGCVFARMTGSGSACFGVFESVEQAASVINCSKWWVQPVNIA